MRGLLFVALLCFTGTLMLSGQRLYQTSSGQKFMLNPDNTWYFVDGVAKVLQDANNGTGRVQEDKYGILMLKALENEVNTYVEWFEKKNEIVETEQSIIQTREASNNTVVLAKLNDKLAALKKEENAYLTQYTKNAQITKRLQASENLPGKKQEKEWNEIAKLLNVQFSPKEEKKQSKPVKEEKPNQEESVLSKKVENFLPSKTKEFLEFLDENPNPATPSEANKSDQKLSAERKKEDKKSAPVMVKEPDCAVQQISDKESDGNDFIALESGSLFQYTPEKLVSYFRDKDFLQARAHLFKKDNKVFLQVGLTFFSKDAARNYGYIPGGSLVALQLINGVIMRLKTTGDSRAELETYTGNTIYNVIIPIDKETLGMLEKVALDNMGIMWSSGFESYPIYEVDFLMRQISCIKKLK